MFMVHRKLGLVLKNAIISFGRNFSGSGIQRGAKFALRKYQEDCINTCAEAINTKGKMRIGVSLPTGSGKTVVFTHLIPKIKPKEGQGGKVLILVHKSELAIQASEACQRYLPDQNVQIDMGSKFKLDWDNDPDVIVGSVPTLGRSDNGRLAQLRPEEFKLIIIDECHHSSANSYISVLNHFNALSKESKVPIIGFSATFNREDEKNLDSVFDEVVFHVDIFELLKMNYISDAKLTNVLLDSSDLSTVSTNSNGEFVLRSLSNEINKPTNNEIVLRTYMKLLQDYDMKSTLVFAVDIAHVNDLYDVFQKYGVRCSKLSSETPADERREIIHNFKAGYTKVLINCGILTEGTDIPNIDCILLVRPTNSRNLLSQMIGRGLRLHPGKECCHIIDFVGIDRDISVEPTLKSIISVEPVRHSKRELKETPEQLMEELQDTDLSQVSEELRVPIDEKFLENLEIEFETYSSLELYSRSLVKVAKETQFYISKSMLKWIRLNTYQWFIKPYGSDHFFVLTKHPQGLQKAFLKGIVTKEFYKSENDAFNEFGKSPCYSLLIYEPIVYTDPRAKFFRFGNFPTRTRKKRLAMKIKNDPRLCITAVENWCKSKQVFGQSMKNAPFRKERASDVQVKTAMKILTKELKARKYSVKDKLAFKAHLTSMTKGQIGEIIDLSVGGFLSSLRRITANIDRTLRRTGAIIDKDSSIEAETSMESSLLDPSIDGTSALEIK